MLKATKDGYVELARGKYKDVRAEYERAYEKAVNEIYGNYESHGADEGRDIWDMQPFENRGDGFGNTESVGSGRLQTNSTRSDEHSGTGDRRKSITPSTKREPSVSEEASDYIQDTKEYREVIDIINQRYNLTNRKKLSPKAIDRFAGKLLAQTKSRYDRGALTERLNALFDYMANSGNELVIKNGLAHIILTTKMLEVKK